MSGNFRASAPDALRQARPRTAHTRPRSRQAADEPRMRGPQEINKNRTNMNTGKADRKDNQSLIEAFHQRVTRQVQREFLVKGSIQTKVILFCLDAGDKPVVVTRKVPEILSVGDERFMDNYLDVKKRISTFIDRVVDDGFHVLCVYHCEYEHDYDGEGYFSSLKTGDDLRNTEVFHYRVSYLESLVTPDGSIQRSSPTFLLLDSEW